MKKIKKVSLLLVILMVISSYVAIPASAVGNYYDSSYYTGECYIGGYQHFWHTFPDPEFYDYDVVIDEDNPYGIRRKLDATATYVYNKEGSSFMFLVAGYNGYYDGDGAYPEDTRTPGRIDVGQRRFLRQWVYENGHAYCAIYTAPIFDGSYSKGLWSPDSIGSYPYANDWSNY